MTDLGDKAPNRSRTENRGARRTAIIIPARSWNAELENLIGALRRQSIVADEIIVVTGTTDVGTNLVMRNSTVETLRQSGVGPANARNFGAKHTSANVLVFLDLDFMPRSREWLAALLSNLTSPQAGIVSGRVVIPKGRISQRFARAMNGLGTPDYGTEDFHVDEPFHSFPGGNLAISRNTFDELLGFDESLPIAEDLDLCIRAFRKGIPMIYSSRATAYHIHRRKLIELLRHGWNTGKGSIAFIHKYGFWNKFLRGTSISVLLVALFLLIFLPISFSVLIGAIAPYVLLLTLIPYFVLVAKFWKNKESRSDPFSFPLVFALYTFSLGMGVLYRFLLSRR